MKRITNNAGQKNVRSVKNVCKKGFNTNKIYVYRRVSKLGEEEWAMLRRVSTDTVGWVSLIGGPLYTPAFVADTYRASLTVACTHRKVYEFNSLEEFLNNKNLL